MKYCMIPAGLLLLIAMVPARLLADSCKPSDAVGTRCSLPVENVRPTQFAVGAVAVRCKAQKISEKSEKALKKYLNGDGRRVPVVVGPDEHFYMTDHHHLAMALYQAGNPDWGRHSKQLQLQIIGSYTGQGMSMDAFWAELQQQKRSYNVDNKGTANMDFALLPQQVAGLLNDPYRTLSRWVRESCGYVKEGKSQCDHIRVEHPHRAPYFMEFYWGEFFRRNLPLTVRDLAVCRSIPYSGLCLENEVDQLKALYTRAMQLASSAPAKAYFEALGLDPWVYGYNPSGEHVRLEWGGDTHACEEPVSP